MMRQATPGTTAIKWSFPDNRLWSEAFAGEGYKTKLPAYEDTLSNSEIIAILLY